MRKRNTNRYSLMLLSVFLFFNFCHQVSASPIGLKIGSTRYSSEVKSLYELRWDKLTRQGWDISCGAAALSTLLTYYGDKPFSEIAITLSILKNSDPALVKQRGGFSLFDLKRFVNAVGLEGLGYGDMSLDDLESFTLPAILPLRIKDFDHFVIFKKRMGNKILLGDPAFGNIIFSSGQFLKMWQSKIAFYVVTEEEKLKLSNPNVMKINKSLKLQPTEVAIPDPRYIPRFLGRITLVPKTRKMEIYSP